MKNISSLLKHGSCALLSSLLIFTGGSIAQASTIPTSVTKINTTAVKSDVATANKAFVYYVSNGSLYRVMSDGTKGQMLLKSFQGVQLTPAGNYLYFMYDEKSTTLLRVPMDGSAKIPSRVEEDIVHFTSDGKYLYYMNEKGAIYRAPVDAKKPSAEAKLITDMADINYPGFQVIDGRVYYNALKSGRTTWLASKAADGSGQVQWITAGSTSAWFTHTDNKSIYMMINTKPEETQYSIDCMVLYSIPKKGGTAKALNPKAPIDANAVYSGSWVNGYYLFNKGIKLDSQDDFDYTNSKAALIDMNGKFIELHNTGVLEAAYLGSDKIVFVDGDFKAYAGTIKGNAITNKKALSIKNVGYVRNLITNDKVRATMLFAESGAYMLQADLSLKEMVGVEWDLCAYKDDVSGLLYVNAGDNGRLYCMSDDGKASIKLCDEKVSRIVLIQKP